MHDVVTVTSSSESVSLDRTLMLRRIPTTTDGKVVDRLQESTRINKPFKPPTSAICRDRIQPSRKRKRVSYQDQQAEDSDSDKQARKKKKGDRDENYQNEGELLAAIKTYPVYKPKPFGQVVFTHHAK